MSVMARTMLRRRFLLYRSAVVLLQAYFRRRRAVHAFAAFAAAVVRVQARVRGRRVRRVVVQIRRSLAATMIQSVFRGIAPRRLLTRSIRACVTLQSFRRMVVCRRVFLVDVAAMREQSNLAFQLQQSESVREAQRLRIEQLEAELAKVWMRLGFRRLCVNGCALLSCEEAHSRWAGALSVNPFLDCASSEPCPSA
jgi:hypothetical protein